MSNRTIIFCTVVSISIFCLAVISMTYAGASTGSQPPSTPLDLGYVPGELLVRFAPKADDMQLSAAEKNQILSSLGAATVIGNYKIVPGLSHVKLPTGVTVEQAIAQLNKTQGIIYAQPNHYLMLCSGQRFPNDPKFEEDKLWGMHNIGQWGATPDADIDAPEAWDIETDASDIIVAVIDSGVDYYHEDLGANMWINPGEDYPPLGVVGPEDFNGVNDDGNYDPEGNPLIDDICGWDFCTRWQDRDSDPMDELGHGTHVSGTIGAVGNNNVGVTGVCWKVKIMALRFIDPNNLGNVGDAIDAIDYAVEWDVKVLNNSWYFLADNPVLRAHIEDAHEAGVIFVAAATNEDRNIDIERVYPASYDLDNIISVMATDWDDNRADWEDIFPPPSKSNYGAVSVDLAAPGKSRTIRKFRLEPMELEVELECLVLMIQLIIRM